MRSFLLFLLFASIGARAQTKATTDDGRRVLLRADSTWTLLGSATTASRAASDTSCDALIITSTDAKGKPSSSSQVLLVSNDNGKTGFGIIITKGIKQGQLLFDLTCAGSTGCVPKYAVVRIVFRDGSHVDVPSDAMANCSGSVPIHFGGTFGRKDLAATLASKPIRSIRVALRADFLERELTEVTSLTVMHSVRCLLK